MDDIISVRGMVLKHSPSGDYDWVATILTAEKGKITAFAKGARKPGNRLSGCVEPFCFGRFKLYVGRNSYSISEAEIENYFEGFRQDLEAACYGTFFLEYASYYTRENNEDTALLNLLYISLKALLKDSFPNRLVRCIYELRALQIEGEFPGTPAAGLLDSTRYSIEHIVTSPLEKLYSFTVSDEVLDEICAFTSKLRKTYIDRPLKSMDMLKSFDESL
ncbi:MAG: DNA repair protein RecO [Butyrivibrio sp.]|nr:DNA repair protein RecO [Butyrivibrio sp.]